VASPPLSPTDIGVARDLIDDVMPDLKRFLERQAINVTARLRSELDAAGTVARREEDERYRSRAGEVSALIAENTLLKLEREIDQLNRDKAQGTLFDEDSRLDEIERSIEAKQEEIHRRTRHYEEVRTQLERERERIVRHLLPTRHRMSGDAQLFPVTIEVLLPRRAS
jgi:vacuolar-type H+-ATPase subunit I/STV1